MNRGDLFLLKQTAENPKKRPVVIVSRDELNGGHSVVVVPFYSQQLEKRKRMNWCAFFQAGEGGLNKDCVAKCDEISSLDKTELDIPNGRIGKFKPPQMERLMNAIKWSLRL